jgi:hypothetical protein
VSWALPYVELLLKGETIKFRPRGNSMRGKIESGQLVTVVPVLDSKEVNKGDIVLCKVKGKYFLHSVWSNHCDTHERFLIGNERGFANGWTPAKNIFGKVIKVEP